MVAEASGGQAARSVAAPPTGRDPRQFPFGLLLVAPGIFESVSGFNWFASEAEAVSFLVDGVWDAIDLPADHKAACRQVFSEVLANCPALDEDVLGSLGAGQEELVVVWAGTFEQVCAGTDEFLADTLRDTAEQLEAPGLLDTPEGLVELMAAYRWQYTCGVLGVQQAVAGMPPGDQRRVVEGFKIALHDSRSSE